MQSKRERERYGRDDGDKNINFHKHNIDINKLIKIEMNWDR